MRTQLLLFLVFFGQAALLAQLSGTALTEYQYGQVPGEREDDFHSVYNKIKLNYSYRSFKLNAGSQVYYSPYSQRNYFSPSWLGANYVHKAWTLKIGNYYETIGRGLLLRSYEIPGALLEDKGFRSKNYFHRDILGASGAYTNKRFALKALWGYSLNNVYPPTQDWAVRRGEEVAAISGEYRFVRQAVEVAGLKVTDGVNEGYYGLGSLSGQLFPFLSYYSAYAFYGGGNQNNSNSGNTYALYGSLNFSLAKFGLSFELKDYRNFLIGSGINEPPALVKEHTYKVLNRRTHELLPENEKGLQLEAFYQLNLWTVFILNYTLAENDFGNQYRFQEWFFEGSTSWGAGTDLKVFVDYAQDPFKGESDRWSSGGVVDQVVQSKYGLKLEGEWQTFVRDKRRVDNYVGTLTFRKKSNWYLSLISEMSNDPFITSSGQKIWLGGTIGGRISKNHSFNLFAGERRGGPACSAGICYEVLDFKGVELRWRVRF